MATSRDDPREALIAGILSVTLIPFTYTIYIYPHYSQNCKEVIQKKKKKKPKREGSTTPIILDRATHP